MGKVMVVDDAVSDLRLMESILKSAGHRVVCCEGGRELEARIVDESPDLLLLDIVMPDRNGYEILSGLKRGQRIKDTPVVFVSSQNKASDRISVKRQGATDYLAKPFSPDELLAMVRHVIG